MPKTRPSTPDLPELTTFPGRLKYARERCNMTRRKLSELTGIDAPRITRLEQGTRVQGMGVATTIRLARALNVSLSWLVLDEGEIGPVILRDPGDGRRKSSRESQVVVPTLRNPVGDGRRKPRRK